MFAKKHTCSRERHRLGHHRAQRPRDDQSDLVPFLGHREHHRQIEVSNSQTAPRPPQAPDPAALT